MVSCSRCTAVAWVPQGDGLFVVAHADGNIYVYDKVKILLLQSDEMYLFIHFSFALLFNMLIMGWQNKEGSIDATFPPVKEASQFLVVHARSSKVFFLFPSLPFPN